MIELDGGIHDLRQAEDAARDARTTEAGFTVLRFRNSAFAASPAVVFEAIRRHMSKLKQTPHPSGSAAHLIPQGEKA